MFENNKTVKLFMSLLDMGKFMLDINTNSKLSICFAIIMNTFKKELVDCKMIMNKLLITDLTNILIYKILELNNWIEISPYFIQSC